LIAEENYFFRLSKYTTQLKDLIGRDVIEVVPNFRKNEVMALLEEGLQDVSFSRTRQSLPWGVPVPDDEEQVMYVWCDALTNYISGLGFGNFDDADYQKFWNNDEVERIHVIGKDITRFHLAIWPGMLLSAGVKVPKKVFVHGFITADGEKMSKSYGNTIDIFMDEKALQKQCNKIVTSSTPLGEPLEYENCNVYKIASLFLDEDGKKELQARYLSGAEGYGNLKKYLKELIWDEFAEAREKREYYLNHIDEVKEILDFGASKAKAIANNKIKAVKDAVGLW
jgi:tryptophanyl-tRNA synthetase